MPNLIAAAGGNGMIRSVSFTRVAARTLALSPIRVRFRISGALRR